MKISKSIHIISGIALAFVTIACKPSAPSSITPDTAQQSKTPSEAEVLTAGNQLAANTLVVVRGTNGRDTDEQGLAATKATILETSSEGATCIVVL